MPDSDGSCRRPGRPSDEALAAAPADAAAEPEDRFGDDPGPRLRVGSARPAAGGRRGSWWLRAGVHPAGPRVPLWAPVEARQVLPGGRVGTFRAVFRGKARLARVELDMAPDLSVRTWLRPGTHLAVQWLGASLRVEPLVPAQVGRRPLAAVDEGPLMRVRTAV